MGILGCLQRVGNTELFWGLGWEGWGGPGGNGIMSSFWGKDGNIGVSMKGWEHRGVLGSAMGRLGVQRGMGSHHYFGVGIGIMGCP